MGVQPFGRILALKFVKVAATSARLPTLRTAHTPVNDTALDAPQTRPTPDDAADRDALRAVARRDRRAFEQLYRRHHPRLARFLRRFTARADLIDDVVNETMWVVWRQAATFRGDSRVGTWIVGIAYRCMLKGLRGAAPADEVSESMLGHTEAAEMSAWHADPQPARELQDWVEHGLRTLPEDQRATLELAYVAGLSCEEIAVTMGCAVGTVKARMFRARVRLRSVMPALANGSATG